MRITNEKDAEDHAVGKHHTAADGHNYERNPWKWLVSKLGKAGAVAALIVVGIAIAAIAAILLRAEITGTASTGSAELRFATLNSATYGTHPGDGSFSPDQDGSPPGVVCDGTITDGVLNVTATGLLDGEGCQFMVMLENASPGEVTNLALDFGANADFGPLGSGAPFEVFDRDIALLPTSLAAGETTTQQVSIIFAPAPGTPGDLTFDASGVAVVGSLDR